MTTVLELEDHSISLQERRLFTLSMAIRGGEVATVMGASGSGKSSLLASVLRYSSQRDDSSFWRMQTFLQTTVIAERVHSCLEG